jgi:hypothetical protein
MNRGPSDEGASPQEEDKARLLFGSRLMVGTKLCICTAARRCFMDLSSNIIVTNNKFSSDVLYSGVSAIHQQGKWGSHQELLKYTVQAEASAWCDFWLLVLLLRWRMQLLRTTSSSHHLPHLLSHYLTVVQCVFSVYLSWEICNKYFRPSDKVAVLMGRMAETTAVCGAL